MVRRVAETALAAGLDPVVVVTPAPPGEVGRVLEGLRLKAAPNEDAAAGMSTSLARGVAAIPPGTSGAVILLGDMPWVRAETVRALVEAHARAPEGGPCVPVHHGRRGNPVLWPARFFRALRSLAGDVGARSLLESSEPVPVEVPDPGVLRDVDTPQDLTDLRAPSISNTRS